MTQSPSRHRSGGEKAWHGRWVEILPFTNKATRFTAPPCDVFFSWGGWQFGWGWGWGFAIEIFLMKTLDLGLGWGEVGRVKCQFWRQCWWCATHQQPLRENPAKSFCDKFSWFAMTIFREIWDGFLWISGFRNDMRWYLTSSWTTSRKYHTGRKPTEASRKKKARTAAWRTFHWHMKNLQKSVRKSDKSYWNSSIGHSSRLRVSPWLAKLLLMEEILHHLGCTSVNIVIYLPISWCRISSINSIMWRLSLRETTWSLKIFI